jgi:hypothetical protein
VPPDFVRQVVQVGVGRKLVLAHDPHGRSRKQVGTLRT